MKNKLATLILSLLLFVANISIGQTKSEKILVKSFNLQGKETILLDLDGAVEVKEWDNKIMRVQMNISLEDAPSHMIKSLVQVGRYNLTAEYGDDFIKIAAPAMRKEIRISGKLLQENIVYTVFAPENVEVKMSDETSARLY